MQHRMVVDRHHDPHQHQAAADVENLLPPGAVRVRAQGRAINLHHADAANQQDHQQQRPVDIANGGVSHTGGRGGAPFEAGATAGRGGATFGSDAGGCPAAGGAPFGEAGGPGVTAGTWAGGGGGGASLPGGTSEEMPDCTINWSSLTAGVVAGCGVVPGVTLNEFSFALIWAACATRTFLSKYAFITSRTMGAANC